MSRRVGLARRASLAEQGQVAKTTKLKVFRTPIGFHDAYVAAPSQKAALAAWGSDANLFARGVAEEVTDPALTEEPLARPGEVIKRLRGSAAEQFAALPPDKPKPPRGKSEPDEASPPKPAPRKAPPPKPKPNRTPLDEAEQALAAAEKRQRTEIKALAEREAELARERRALADRQQAESEELQAAVEQARAAYDRALAAWRR
jgi:hypothetical protein